MKKILLNLCLLLIIVLVACNTSKNKANTSLSEQIQPVKSSQPQKNEMSEAVKHVAPVPQYEKKVTSAKRNRLGGIQASEVTKDSIIKN